MGCFQAPREFWVIGTRSCFPAAVLTDFHPLGGLKQQKWTLAVLETDIKNEAARRRLRGRVLPGSFTFWGLETFRGL